MLSKIESVIYTEQYLGNVYFPQNLVVVVKIGFTESF
jgi:hypothetical protein